MWEPKTIMLVCIAIIPLSSAQFPNLIPPSLRATAQHREILQEMQQELKEHFQNSPQGLTFSTEDWSTNLELPGGIFKKTSRPKLNLTDLAKFLIPTASSNDQISQQCREDSWLYAESLANLTGWALKMHDATGKMPDGVISGNYHAMGHFDECLQVNGPIVDSDPQFTGKYCTVFLSAQEVPESQSKEPDTKSAFLLLRLLSLLLPYTDPVLTNQTTATAAYLPSLAFCLPSTCSAKDIGVGVADSIGIFVLGQKHIVPITGEDYCTVEGTEIEFDAATITVIVVLSILAILLVLGTAYDSYLQWNDASREDLLMGNQMLLSFSILSNAAKILNANGTGEGSLSCLHGIRFLSMTWVVLGHVWGQNMFAPDANAAQAKQDGFVWTMQTVTNASVSVDSFFFLSGLLVAYVTLREMDKCKGRLNVPLMYLHRYLRLTPVYAFILGIIATLLPYLGSGPYWGSLTAMSNGCRGGWWQHLLYLNNFFCYNNDVNLCMGETWYLANDMQMFLVSPIFIYVLWHWPKPGVAFLGVATLAFIFETMTIVSIENLPAGTLFTRPDFGDSRHSEFDAFNDYYQATWCRIAPYLVGIFMGFVCHKSRNYEVKMKPWVVITGWSLATAMALSVLYGLIGYLDQTAVPIIPELASVLYASLHRTTWAISLSWMVFACVHGYGGFVNRFLSWSAFIPLSRLTYCTYLIHLNFIGFYYAGLRMVFYYTIIDSVFNFLSILTISMVLAFVVSVCIEAPFLNVEKLLFAPKRQPPRKEVKISVEGKVNSGFEK